MSVIRFLLCAGLAVVAGLAMANATGKVSLQIVVMSAFYTALVIGDAIVNALKELASKSSKGVG